MESWSIKTEKWKSDRLLIHSNLESSVGLAVSKQCALQVIHEGWRRSWEEVPSRHLLSPSRLCLCPYLHLVLERLDSCTPKTMLKQWKTRGREKKEVILSRKKHEILLPSRSLRRRLCLLSVLLHPSLEALLSLSSLGFSWFSRAFCTLLPQLLLCVPAKPESLSLPGNSGPY